MIYPLVSIDIETTGLDPSYCQMIEFAAVIDTGEGAVEDQPRLQTYVSHKIIQGEPFALSLNKRILDVLAARPADCRICCAEDVGPLLYKFLKDNNALSRPPAGKNFDKFDANFLKLLPNFELSWFHRRTLDPGSMYVRPTDDNIPSTEECMRRAGMDGVVSHEALADCRTVAELIRRHFFGKPDPDARAKAIEAFEKGDYKTTTQLVEEIKATMTEGQRAAYLEAQRANFKYPGPGPRQAMPTP